MNIFDPPLSVVLNSRKFPRPIIATRIYLSEDHLSAKTKVVDWLTDYSLMIDYRLTNDMNFRRFVCKYLCQNGDHNCFDNDHYGQSSYLDHPGRIFLCLWSLGLLYLCPASPCLCHYDLSLCLYLCPSPSLCLLQLFHDLSESDHFQFDVAVVHVCRFCKKIQILITNQPIYQVRCLYGNRHQNNW